MNPMQLCDKYKIDMYNRYYELVRDMPNRSRIYELAWKIEQMTAPKRMSRLERTVYFHRWARAVHILQGGEDDNKAALSDDFLSDAVLSERLQKLIDVLKSKAKTDEQRSEIERAQRLLQPNIEPTEDTEEDSQTEQEQTTKNVPTIVKYSDKAFAVIGNTYSYRSEIKAAGGKFNRYLQINGKTNVGWIVPAKNIHKLKFDGVPAAATDAEATSATTTAATSATSLKPAAVAPKPVAQRRADLDSYMKWKPKSVFETEIRKLFESMRHSVIKEAAEVEARSAESKKKELEELNTPPDDWTDTKKAWKEASKDRREYLQESRERSLKDYKEMKSKDWDEYSPELKSYIVDEFRELASMQGGKPTKEQLETALRVLEQQSFEKVKGLDYYPTPPDIVETALDKIDLKPGMFVLEPSAGKGNFADAIRRRLGEGGDNNLHVIELAEHNRKILELKEYNIVGDNFMNFASEGKKANGDDYLTDALVYDAIVMNPPFLKGIDYVHLERAFKLLADGGQLVAIVPAGSYMGNSGEAVERRLWIESNSGTIQVIPAKQYNVNMEFTSLTTDLAIVTMKKKAKEQYHSDLQHGVTAEDTQRGVVYEKGELYMPERNPDERDKGFIEPEIVMAEEELVPKDAPDYFRKIKTKVPVPLFNHQIFGVNHAIHAMEKHGGFLLADGTGAGKTLQMLMVAAYYWQKTNKPVIIFSIDKKVLTTSFMADAKKAGFPVPEYKPIEESKPVKRPKNYQGLYDKLDKDAQKTAKSIPTDVNLPQVVYGDERTLLLRPGINLFTYNALSNIRIGSNYEADIIAAEHDMKTNQQFWNNVKREGNQALKGENIEMAEHIRNFLAATGQTVNKDNKDSLWANEVEKASLDDKFADHRRFYQLVGGKLPKIEEAGRKLVEAQDRMTAAIEAKVRNLYKGSALVVFDEAHKIKNLLLNLEKQAGRAFYAKFITDGAEKVMFATATPTDRPQDILYLKRAGLFLDDQDFVRKMNTVGVYYQPPKYNTEKVMVRRGRWALQGASSAERLEIANAMLSNLFTFVTRQGCMLRREIKYVNLEAKFVDVEISHSVKFDLQAATEAVTKRDSDGRKRINRLAQLQRHQEITETYKIDAAIEHTKAEIAEGRNVVIFVNLVDEDEKERDDGTNKSGTVRILKNRLSKLYGDSAVGVLVGATGAYEEYRRLQNVDQFQKGTRRILIGTITSGGTGISLDDQIGNAPRTIVIVNAPLSFINIMQGVGRVVRANSKSRSRVVMLFAETDHPDENEKIIPVEYWLKRLVGNKFRTLRAAVKGEIGALDPAALKRAEQAGAAGAVGMIDKEEEKETTPNKHSLFSKTDKRIDGYDMPTPTNIIVSKISNSYRQTLLIHFRNAGDFKAWETANQDFIDKWKLEKNIETSFRRYNGQHYGYNSYGNWTSTYDLWNAMLNLAKPEEPKYLTSERSVFDIGDKAQSTTDILSTGTKTGEEGTIVGIMPFVVGQNSNGSIYRYEYDVKWDKTGLTSIALHLWQIRPLTDDAEEENLGGLADKDNKQIRFSKLVKILERKLDQYQKMPEKENKPYLSRDKSDIQTAVKFWTTPVPRYSPPSQSWIDYKKVEAEAEHAAEYLCEHHFLHESDKPIGEYSILVEDKTANPIESNKFNAKQTAKFDKVIALWESYCPHWIIHPQISNDIFNEKILNLQIFISGRREKRLKKNPKNKATLMLAKELGLEEQSE